MAASGPPPRIAAAFFRPDDPRVIPSFNDPVSVSCPHCGSTDAMEWPILQDVRSFFCRSCRSFKLRCAHVQTVAEQQGTVLHGRIAVDALGDRWLVPE